MVIKIPKFKATIFLLYLTIISMLLFPDTPFGFRIDDILILILFCIIFFKSGGKIKVSVYPVIIFFTYFFILLLSVLYNLNFFEFGKTNYGYHLNSSLDLFVKEITRALKILVIFIICYNMNPTSKKTEKVLSYFLKISYVLTVIGIMQYSNLLGVNEFISNHYNPGDSHNALISDDFIQNGQLRINATFFNPNIYAAFLLIPLSLSLNRALLKNKPIYFIGVGMIMVNLVFTQSRTALLSAIIMILLYIAYVTFIMKKIRLNNLIVYSLSPIIIFYLLNSINIDIINRFHGVFSSEIVNTSGRGPVMNQMKEILTNSPFLGYSPIVTNNIASDNEIKIFIHYDGILGLFFYFVFIYILYRKVKVSLISKENKFFLFTLILNILLIGTTNGFIISNRIFPIFILIYTLTVNSDQNEKVVMPNHAFNGQVKI